MYPHRFTNINEFVQRIALDCVRYGYWYYVTGRIPEGREPEEIDAKLLKKYDIGVSRWVRARRKKAGRANVHYARHQDFFVMMASKGESRWFQEERGIADIRRSPLVRAGYSISYKECSATGRGHVAVRIHPDEYRALKAYFVGLASHRTAERLAEEFRCLPFEPYAGVRQQSWNILRAVNAARKRASFELVDPGVLRRKRRVYRIATRWHAGLPESGELTGRAA